MEELKLYIATIIEKYGAQSSKKIIVAYSVEEAREFLSLWNYQHKNMYLSLSLKELKRSKKNEKYFTRYHNEQYYNEILKGLKYANKSSKENVQEEM